MGTRDAAPRPTDLLPRGLEPFAERLLELLGPHRAGELLGTMRAPKRKAYWVNPLRGGAPLAGSERVPGAPGCWVLTGEADGDLANRPEVRDGRLYPMNPASTLAVAALAPQPGEELLDLAAAPGGKTLLMAAAMHNAGRIAAVEPVKGRFHRMRANLARCGVTNVALYASDGRAVGGKVPGRFDGVLLDAPCSSEARIRLDSPRTYAHWKPRKIKEAARKQRALLRSAFAALKAGGRLVYSTCSFAPEENEANVDYLLAREPSAQLVALEVCPSLMPGIEQWRGRLFHGRLPLTGRRLPDDLWDGFFVAKIVKRASPGALVQ